MRIFLTLALLVWGCGPAPDEGSDGAAARSGDADGGDPDDAATGGAPDLAAGGLPVLGPFVVVADETAFAINGDGADVDAVEFRCDGSEGFAVRGAGDLYEGADPAAAAGAPQGCDDPEACAASLGVTGHLVVELDGAVDLRGCTVRVYEVSDRSDEVFRVYACPGFAFEGDCRSLGSGEDGDTFEAIVE